MDEQGLKTVLLIDDDEITLSCMHDALQQHGFRVLIAKNGLEAIDTTKNYPGSIDVAVLDVIMPGLEGDEVQPFLQFHRPDMKVIVCSGYSLNERIQGMLDRGASTFMQKPFNLIQLTTAVDSVLV